MDQDKRDSSLHTCPEVVNKYIGECPKLKIVSKDLGRSYDKNFRSLKSLHVRNYLHISQEYERPKEKMCF